MPDQRVSAALLAAVIERAHGCCEYCRSQSRFAMQSFSVERILPRSKGGAMALDNLALSCQGCNNHKHTKTVGRDPVSGQNIRLFDPRAHRWNEHFTWLEEYTLIDGLTAIGRATVIALQLNRAGLVNLRDILARAGEHPPD